MEFWILNFEFWIEEEEKIASRKGRKDAKEGGLNSWSSYFAPWRLCARFLSENGEKRILVKRLIDD